MKFNKKRFVRKLYPLNPKWRSMLLPSEIPEELSRTIAEHERLAIEDFIVFSYSDAESWFGIHLQGILFSSNGETGFILYENIQELEVPMDHLNPDPAWKTRVKHLMVTDRSGSRIALETDSEGVVFTIHMLINFGRRGVESNEKG